MPRGPDRAKRKLWRRRLSEFDRGHATVAEFCRRQAVAVSSFYRWRNKLARGPVASGRQRWGITTQRRHARPRDRSRRGAMTSRPEVVSNERLNFVPIEITGAPRIEVHLSNGTRVTVPCHDREVIGAVFACLRTDAQEARPC